MESVGVDTFLTEKIFHLINLMILLHIIWKLSKFTKFEKISRLDLMLKTLVTPKCVLWKNGEDEDEMQIMRHCITVYSVCKDKYNL